MPRSIKDKGEVGDEYIIVIRWCDSGGESDGSWEASIYGETGCNTCGDTLENVLDMVKDVLDLCLENELVEDEK